MSANDVKTVEFVRGDTGVRLFQCYDKEAVCKDEASFRRIDEFASLDLDAAVRLSETCCMCRSNLNGKMVIVKLLDGTRGCMDSYKCCAGNDACAAAVVSENLKWIRENTLGGEEQDAECKCSHWERPIVTADYVQYRSCSPTFRSCAFHSPWLCKAGDFEVDDGAPTCASCSREMLTESTKFSAWFYARGFGKTRLGCTFKCLLDAGRGLFDEFSK